MDRRDDPENNKYRVYLGISSDGGNVFGTNFAIDNGSEVTQANVLPDFPTQNVWDSKALIVVWSSFGAPAGVVVGGAQFK
jgi:hypothetical protein